MEEGRRILSVLEAYASILPSVAAAATYLIYITAAILGLISASMLVELLGVRGTTLWVIYALSFVIVFMIASAGVSKMWSVLTVLEAFKAGSELKYSKSNLLIWTIAFILASVTFLLRTPFSSFVLFVSLGVGLGNLLSALSLTGRYRYGPLLVGAYLLLCIPSYYYLPKFAEGLLLFHLVLSYFAVSLWYAFEGQREALVILNAARGDDKETH